MIQKFKFHWRRLGLSKAWPIFAGLIILMPIVCVAEFTLDGSLFGLAGLILIYFRFLRKR